MNATHCTLEDSEGMEARCMRFVERMAHKYYHTRAVGGCPVSKDRKRAVVTFRPTEEHRAQVTALIAARTMSASAIAKKVGVPSSYVIRQRVKLGIVLPDGRAFRAKAV